MHTYANYLNYYYITRACARERVPVPCYRGITLLTACVSVLCRFTPCFTPVLHDFSADLPDFERFLLNS